MNETKQTLDRWMFEQGFSTYKELAEYLGTKPATLDAWKQRKEIPKKAVSKYSFLNSQKEIKSTLNDGSSGENFKLGLLPKTKKSSLRKIPYYDCFEASAGFGAINGDVRDPEHIHLPERFLNGASSSTEAIKCRGDSMSPSINSGDIMFIDREDIEIKDGEVYVVRCAEELFVKRLFKLPGQIMARSDNAGAGYGEFSVNLKESQILGRVIYRMERV